MFKLILGAVLICVAPPAVKAGVIVGLGASKLAGVSTSIIGPVGLTPAPNNDASPAPNPNSVFYTVFQTSPGMIEVEFLTGNSGGTTEYLFKQSLFNLGQSTWKGIKYQLGFGIGAGFVASTAEDLLDFNFGELDALPTSSHFKALKHRADSLTWSNGAVSLFPPLGQAFTIDVPDDLASYNPTGQSRFTLRQIAVTVPEPALTGLLALGAVAVALARRRRSIDGRSSRHEAITG